METCQLDAPNCTKSRGRSQLFVSLPKMKFSAHKDSSFLEH